MSDRPDDRPPRPQRMILMGTGPFAVPSFEAIRQAGHEVLLVVTRPQPPVKSRKGPPPAPVRGWAQQHGLPIRDPDSINDPQMVDELTRLSASLLVVCDYGQILKPAALASTPLGGINLHGSLLPSYRGAAPVQRAMLQGETVTGVTVIHMTPRLDAGPILAVRETPIDEHETAGQLEARLAELGVEATLDAITQLADWDGQRPIGMPQPASRVSKAPRLHKSEGRIDWTAPSRMIHCHVRGMQPWPVAFTFLTVRPDKPPLRLAVKEVAPVPSPRPDGAEPGQILSAERFHVATGDGVVEIRRLQPAGRREMSGEEFIRGHQPAAGTRLEPAAA